MEIMSSMRLLLTSFLLLAGMARSFGMSIPAQEKVYLHFDQTGYFLKETMWFTAYVLNESNRPTDISKILYVELLSPEGGPVKTHKYKIEDGCATVSSIWTAPTSPDSSRSGPTHGT